MIEPHGKEEVQLRQILYLFYICQNITICFTFHTYDLLSFVLKCQAKSTVSLLLAVYTVLNTPLTNLQLKNQFLFVIQVSVQLNFLIKTFSEL